MTDRYMKDSFADHCTRVAEEAAVTWRSEHPGEDVPAKVYVDAALRQLGRPTQRMTRAGDRYWPDSFDWHGFMKAAWEPEIPRLQGPLQVVDYRTKA